MKKLLSRFSALLLLSAFVAASCEQADLLPDLGQNPNFIVDYSEMAPSPGGVCELPPCAIAIAQAEARLLETAEDHCGRLVIAVPCCDQQGMPVMAALQYETLCAAKIPSYLPDTQALPLEANSYGIEVRRSDCFAGGTSLEVVFRDTGNPLPIGPFLFYWWIDGEYAGANMRLECAQGKVAWLLLVNAWEGDKYFYELPLHDTRVDK
jgi:hypothetical protein